MQNALLLTDPSEQFSLAKALNLEIHEPFRKQLREKQRGRNVEHIFFTNQTICLYAKLRTTCVIMPF
jgi:hypothetical protein